MKEKGFQVIIPTLLLKTLPHAQQRQGQTMLPNFALNLFSDSAKPIKTFPTLLSYPKLKMNMRYDNSKS